MISILFIFYMACQGFMFCLLTFLCLVKKEIDIEKENIVMMSLLIAFGPLGVMAFLGVVMHERLQSWKRLHCQRALTKWETKAMADAGERSKWDWHTKKAESEARYNLLRETIQCLTDKELNLLVSVSRDTYELEKPVREAVMDEIIHREIMK